MFDLFIKGDEIKNINLDRKTKAKTICTWMIHVI